MVKELQGPKTVFVISPIGTPGTSDHQRHLLTLEYIIKKALPPPTWHVIRADDEASPDSIGGKVIERIVESDLIVAVLTDQNANVFYELAVAHGYKRPVIHLMEAGQKIPFDVSDQRAIFYNLTDPASVDSAQSRLEEAARYLQDTEPNAKNPLTQYDAFKTISTSSTDDLGAVVAEALQGMSESISRLSRRIDAFDTRSINEQTNGSSYLGRWSERDILRRIDQIEVQLAGLENDEAADASRIRSLANERDLLLRLRRDRNRGRSFGVGQGKLSGSPSDA